ncbi:MAG: class I SAM-dependent methyltransferase [Candidatus Eremiobacteraeota bacterium]|nr:class I SAM-dependent methyltransferase [Candidatus Eremiobacteraeota bacterium]
MSLETRQTVAEIADALLEESTLLYGVPYSKDDPAFGNLRPYLTDVNRQDFRIQDMLPVLPTDLMASPRRILDLGSGPGIFTLRMCGFGHDAYGIDLDEKKIALAHAHVRESGLPRDWAEKLCVADAGRLPFEGGTFDLVASYHVLEHVSDLRSVLYEAVRVTKPGGYLHLQAPDYRFSYDTHYMMPWPRMMPPAQALAWTTAMGRPSGGIDTIYRVTMPEVAALLDSLDCTIHTTLMREHRDNAVHPYRGSIPADPIVFQAGADVSTIANELRRLASVNELPDIYRTCLEFTIVAQRNR